MYNFNIRQMIFSKRLWIHKLTILHVYCNYIIIKMYYYNLKLEDIMTAKRLLSRKIAFLKGMKKNQRKHCLYCCDTVEFDWVQPREIQDKK